MGLTSKPNPEVVGKVRAEANLLAANLQRHRPVRRDGEDRDVRARHQTAVLEEPHDVEVELQVLREPLERDAFAGRDLVQWSEVAVVDGMRRPGDGIAVHACSWVAEDVDHPLLDLIGDDASPLRGLLVRQVPRKTDDLYEEPLRQTVAADELLGDAT